MISKDFGVGELRRALRRGMTLLAAVFAFSIFVNLLMLTGPLFMLQVYDRVLSSRSEETLVALFLLVAVLYLLQGLLDYARGRVLARVGARFQSALDGRVFDAQLRRALSPQFQSAPASGLRDLETIQSALCSPAMLAVFDVPWTPFFVMAIFILHPYLGWLTLAGGGILIVLTILNDVLTRKLVSGAQSTSAIANTFSEQVRGASEIVLAQGMKPHVRGRWEDMRVRSQEQNLSASDWNGIFSTMTKTFRLFLQSASLALGAWLVLRQEMTGGGIVASSVLLGRALAPIEQSIAQWSLVQKSFSGWKSLAEILMTTPPETERHQLSEPLPSLQVRSLSVLSPEARKPTLSKLHFELQPGQILGIIGKSGSGKSTLAKAIVGIIPPSAGEIRLGGATLDQYDSASLGRHIGYLPQSVTLFTGTIAENIARMSQQPDDAKVIEAAKRANAHEMILGLPEGYRTRLSGGDTHLSGGQRQRIGLARAFYGDPVLLVLDEPNSALDIEGAEALNKAIKEFRGLNRTVIIMTHRPLAIAECDRLIVLEGGTIRSNGPRDEVLNSAVRNKQEVRRAISQGVQP